MARCKTVDKNENLRFYIIGLGRAAPADGGRGAAGAARKKEELQMSERTKKIILWSACGVVGFALVIMLLLIFLLPGIRPQAQSSSVAVSSSSQASSSSEADTRLEDAKSQNSDVVAWLTVPGTEIDDPVVQAADNDYYLRRTWLGESDVWGSYFLDYECHAREVASLDKVSIIYGHSNGDSKDDKNFSQIKRWEDADFAAQNPTFTLRLTDGTLTTWQVFAASKVPVEGENAVYYLDPNPSGETYSALLNTLRAASAQSFDGVEVTSQDKILILSTCTSNDIVRYVLCAKLVA